MYKFFNSPWFVRQLNRSLWLAMLTGIFWNHTDALLAAGFVFAVLLYFLAPVLLIGGFFYICVRMISYGFRGSE